jgi:3-oxoacyl-(acyl-carrier-protein) synthase
MPQKAASLHDRTPDGFVLGEGGGVVITGISREYAQARRQNLWHEAWRLGV